MILKWVGIYNISIEKPTDTLINYSNYFVLENAHKGLAKLLLD